MYDIAHIRESDQEIQPVSVHLLGVKELAEAYGAKIGVKHLAGLAGVLHDLGKYTDDFGEYIKDAVSNPHSPPKRGSVDHSTAGGKFLYELFHTGRDIDKYKGMVAEIVGNTIISHHGYLQDYLNPDLDSPYLNRVRDKELPEFNRTQQVFFEKVMNQVDFNHYVDKAAKELEVYVKVGNVSHVEQELMFLTKYIFSALIDADRTNTRLFEENQAHYSVKHNEKQFDLYYERLISTIHSLQEKPDAHTPINLLRSEMSEQCDRFAEKSSGIYTLSIPTGGGKTLASLRYGLKHANLYKKRE